MHVRGLYLRRDRYLCALTSRECRSLSVCMQVGYACVDIIICVQECGLCVRGHHYLCAGMWVMCALTSFVCMSVGYMCVDIK